MWHRSCIIFLVCAFVALPVFWLLFAVPGDVPAPMATATWQPVNHGKPLFSGIAYQGITTSTIYLPYICKEGDCDGQPFVPTPIPTWEPVEACSDTMRGPLYRDMVSSTVDFVEPIAVWAEESCCDPDIAYSDGVFIGRVLGLIPTILSKIFTLLFNIVSVAIGYIGSIIGLLASPAHDFEISCTGEAEAFCFGLAAIMSLDDQAGGILTVIIGMVVAALSFFLVMWIVNQVRDMMQPGTGDSE